MKNVRKWMPVIMVLFTVLGCSKFTSSTDSSKYTSDVDKFSIAFPGGPEGVKKEDDDAKFASKGTSYSKGFDNRSDNYRSFDVATYELLTSPDGMEHRDILEIGLNGWEDAAGTVVKDIDVDGKKAIDSVRTVEIGPVAMTFREAVFWSPKNKKMYVVKVAATKKENVSTKEADDFINSFRIAE